jgi:hypothetical protein
MLTYTEAELAYRRDVSSATRVSNVEVDKSSNEPLDLRNNSQLYNFSPFWLPRKIFLK